MSSSVSRKSLGLFLYSLLHSSIFSPTPPLPSRDHFLNHDVIESDIISSRFLLYLKYIFVLFIDKRVVLTKGNFSKLLYTNIWLFGYFFMKQSRARGLLSIPIQGFNRLVQSCPILFITHVVYVMASAYRRCLSISKQRTHDLDYPRNSSDFLGRI